MTEQQWNQLQGQMEGMGRAIAALAAELNGNATIAIGNYVERLRSEADKLDALQGSVLLPKAAEVMRKVAQLSYSSSD